MEALILILILAVTFVAFIGVIGQALKISSRSRDLSKAISEAEMLFFEVESGLRPDLANEGGRGELDGFQYEIKSQSGEFSSALSNRFSLNRQEVLDFECVALQGAVQ